MEHLQILVDGLKQLQKLLNLEFMKYKLLKLVKEFQEEFMVKFNILLKECHKL